MEESATDPKKVDDREPSSSVQIRTQLSVYLRNKPGELAKVTRDLSEAGINIDGLTVADTVDHAVVRFIVNESQKAKGLLREDDLFVVETDVLSFDLENEPGALASVAESLAEREINIEYAYYTASPTQNRGFNVIKVSDARRAEQLLEQMASEGES